MIPDSDERWVDINEGRYAVSNTGKVRSYLNTNKRKRLIPLVLKPSFPLGYPSITMWDHCVCTRSVIHRLVALAFVSGRTDERNEVNHIDCNKKNNHADNLEWVNSSENKFHAYRNGVRIPKIGSQVWTAKLTEDQIPDIRSRLRDGESQSAIARTLGVHSSTIWRIANFLGWKNVEGSL